MIVILHHLDCFSENYFGTTTYMACQLILLVNFSEKTHISLSDSHLQIISYVDPPGTTPGLIGSPMAVPWSGAPVVAWRSGCSPSVPGILRCVPSCLVAVFVVIQLRCVGKGCNPQLTIPSNWVVHGSGS